MSADDVLANEDLLQMDQFNDDFAMEYLASNHTTERETVQGQQQPKRLLILEQMNTSVSSQATMTMEQRFAQPFPFPQPQIAANIVAGLKLTKYKNLPTQFSLMTQIVHLNPLLPLYEQGFYPSAKPEFAFPSDVQDPPSDISNNNNEDNDNEEREETKQASKKTYKPRKPRAKKHKYFTMYRNLFHHVICNIKPKEASILQEGQGIQFFSTRVNCPQESTASDYWEEYEGKRVYIHDNVGYSGNAKRFKKDPTRGERALILDVTITDSEGNPVSQCAPCKDYYVHQKYFKANPKSAGKLMLIKNSATMNIKDGQFEVVTKMMCCCVHHSLECFLLTIDLTDANTSELVYRTRLPVNVKQWRKSNQERDPLKIDMVLYDGDDKKTWCAVEGDRESDDSR